MQRFIKGAFCVLTLGFLSTPVFADDAAFYSGTHLCNGKISLDDWRLSSDRTRADIAYRRDNSNSFNLLELTAQSADNKNIIYSDRRSRPWLAVRIESDGDRLTGLWLNRKGQPQDDCEPFQLARTKSTKDRMDDLFALLETAEPTVAQARSAASEQKKLPPMNLLPELDQQNYRQKYRDLAPKFWERFYQSEAARLAKAPIGSASEREQLVTELRAATALDLTSAKSIDDDYAGRAAALDFLRMTADRLAETEQPLSAISFDKFCKRLEAFNYIDIDKLELVTGLPVEYWDRAFAEALITEAQKCEQGKNVVRTLTQNYPEIEGRQQAAVWLREQRKRLLELPLSLASFRESNGLNLLREELRKHDVSMKAYDRFIGSSLEVRRSEMEQAARTEIQQSFFNETPQSLPLSKARSRCDELVGQQWGNDAISRLYEACRTAADEYRDRSVRQLLQAQVDKIMASPRNIVGLQANNWYQIDTNTLDGVSPSRAILSEIDQKLAPAREEAVSSAVNEVTTAFASADPLADTSDALVGKCNDLPMFAADNLRPLIDACRKSAQSFTLRRQEALCDKAIVDSDVSEKMALASIKPSASSPATISVRNLICGGARQNISVKFPATGMLWWGKQHIEIQFPKPLNGKADRIIRGIVEPVDGSDTDWTLTEMEEGNNALPIPQERILSCVAQQGFCF